MFSDIEREYRKGLPEARFRRFYSLPAVAVVMIGLILAFVTKWNSLIIAAVMGVILLLFVWLFFWRDMRRTIGKLPNQTFKEKLILYADYDNRKRLETLFASLQKHHIHAQEQVKLLLDHYQQQQPGVAKPNFLAWFISALMTLISVTVIAYDDDARAVDLEKLAAVVLTTLSVALIVITPLLVVVVFRSRLQSQRIKTDALLIEDLAYIYINFDELSDRLIV